MLTRRAFLATAGAAATGLVASRVAGAEWFAAKGIGPIGVQLFSLPKLLEKDFAGTIAMLAKLGYKEIELFGPYPFSVQSAKDSWSALTPQLGFSGSGYFGHSAKEVRQILDRNGLVAPSMHVDLDTMRKRLDQVGEAAHTLGHRYAGIASIPPEKRRTLD